MRLLTVLFVILLSGILTHSQLALAYAATGLSLWFEKMIPSLLPFMILSGIMVRMNLTEKIACVVYPVVRPIFRCEKTYVMPC